MSITSPNQIEILSDNSEELFQKVEAELSQWKEYKPEPGEKTMRIKVKIQGHYTTGEEAAVSKRYRAAGWAIVYAERKYPKEEDKKHTFFYFEAPLPVMRKMEEYQTADDRGVGEVTEG